MDEPVREPCFHCSEPAALSARICPHCRESLLADVVLDAFITDARIRYQAARALSKLGPPVPSFLELQSLLVAPDPTVLRGVTRDVAHRALGMLAVYELSGRSEPASEPPKENKVTVARVTAVVAGVAMLGGLGWLALRASSDEKPGAPEVLELATAEIAELAAPATVSVVCRDSVGAGFFVTPDRVLTNAHVLCGGFQTLQVELADGRLEEGKVLNVNEDFDVALIEVTGVDETPLPLGEASGLSVGDDIVVIGTPLGMDHTVHEGAVSHVARHMYGMTYIQIDANVNPGNSGGPVLDTRGRVVGILSMGVPGAVGLGFALPVNYLYEGEPPMLRRQGEPLEGWLEMLDSAASQEREDIAKAAQSFQNPFLLAASSAAVGRLQVVVIQRFIGSPRSRGLDFTVERDRERLCRGEIEIALWQEIDSRFELDTSKPQLKWLVKHGLADDLYLGVSSPRQELCREAGPLVGADLVLEQGDPDGERLIIASGPLR